MSAALPPARRFDLRDSLSSQLVTPSDYKQLANALRRKAESRDETRPFHMIGRNDYRKLVTLKLAGRSDENIARLFDVPLVQLRPHISRAMNEFKAGKIKADMKEVTDEAKRVVDEKMEPLYEAYDGSAQATDPLTGIPTEAAAVVTSISVIA